MIGNSVIRENPYGLTKLRNKTCHACGVSELSRSRIRGVAAKEEGYVNPEESFDNSTYADEMHGEESELRLSSTL